MVHEDYNRFVRVHGENALDFDQFVRLYVARSEDSKIRIPRMVDRWFDNPTNDAGRHIRDCIEAYDAKERTRLEAELFTQKTRLNGAMRSLASKPTKKAENDQRVATNKIAAAETKLAGLRSDKITPDDRRFFPGNWWVPVFVAAGDARRIMPMRYQCRPCGTPAFYDTKYPGTYNARRDNLGKFWKDVFGYSHAMLIAERFYENVEGPDGKNQVLEFVPKDGAPMYVACLYSHWTDPDGQLPELWSFAAVTDEPEPEVAAAGHDRTIINLRPENVDAWLRPDATNLQGLHALMDDKQHPFYEHRIAA
jgi:putative SOS response-associated peptidase YedK